MELAKFIHADESETLYMARFMLFLFVFSGTTLFGICISKQLK